MPSRTGVVIAILTLTVLCALPCFAQSASVTVNAAGTGPRIGPMHYGIFYEEINHAGDAGLWAELIKNRSFEDSTATDGWTKLTTSGAACTLAADTASPPNTYNTHELAINVTAIGAGKAGLYNSGYYSLPITSGKSYNCVIYARKASGFAGSLSIRLEDSSAAASNTYTITNSNLATTWTKYSFTLTATRTLSQARLAITTASTGTFYLTYVSMMPGDAVDGFRPDLLQLLKDLKPGFVRFPGGCYVEGNVLAEAWQWKGGIGPQEARRTHWNLWGYWNTNGLGLYEYLLLCEKLGAEPLLVINCGMSHSETVQDAALDPYIQDAMDAIEFANGDITTTWGAQRAAMGHPAPFGLEYMEIGNENGGTVYAANFTRFYDTIRASYPGIKLIANVWGGYPTNRTPDLIDEHYYSSPDWFSGETHHYDTYSRTGPKVYVGEYACTSDCGQGNLRAGLGEAMFMMGMERNADVVQLCSYAPLFVNTSNRAWNPDLIPFNASKSYGTPSYYVQKLLSTNRGDQILPTTSTGPVKVMGQNGGIGVGTWVTQSEYADVVVTNGTTTLYQSNFANGTAGWTVDGGTWGVVSGALQQTSNNADCRDVYYAPTWTDYTLTLRARKISGSEGFLIMFRVQDHNNWYWWNIGGWNNTKTAVERCMGGAKTIPAGASQTHSIQAGVWYNIKIEVQGTHFKCYLKLETDANYTLMHDFTDTPSSPAFDAVATREDSTGDVLVKVVNRSSSTLTNTPITINNTKWPRAKATVTTLTSAADTDENSITNPTLVAPTQTQLTGLMLPFNYTLAPCSLTIFRLSMDVQNAATLADARKLPDNTPVRLTGKVLYYKSGAVGYVEEPNRSGGMRVEGVIAPSINKLVTVIGTMRTSTSGERYIESTDMPSGADATILPLGASNKSLLGGDFGLQEGVWGWTVTGASQREWHKANGLNTIGLLVKTWGKFTPVNSTSFTIDDGTGVNIKCVVPTGVTINSGWQYLQITGISSCEKVQAGDHYELHSLLRIRSQSDIVPIQ